MTALMHRRELLRILGASLAIPAIGGLLSAEGGQKRVSGLVNLADFDDLARQRLSRMAYEYIAGGAGDEITMRWNREALDAIRLNPRVLVDVQPVDTRVSLFGEEYNFPVLLAPTAFHRLAHREGEVETARGAEAGRVPFVVSSLSTRKLADIRKATKQPLWFQLFVLQKERREFVREVLAEAKEASCRAILLTVDAPVTGARNRSERAKFHLPEAWETPYYPDRTGRKQSGGLPISGALTWSDVDWLRANTDLPVLLKGILNPIDAKQAVTAGVNGIIVSNHGGRELDTVPASITILPKIVEAVENRLPVLMDSGIRRGTDILKALALGAKAVLIGRPYLYGLACGGAEGVSRVVGILRREFEMAMVLVGKGNLSEVTKEVLG
jgi:4-hydroxymandelate oxidase